MADPTYQMLWHCKQCETRDLLALTQRYCPNCGTAQDASNRYFPEEGKEVAVENHRFVGVDWPCAYCEAPNSAASAFCTHCGGPRDGEKVVALVKDPAEGAQRASAEKGTPKTPTSTLAPTAHMASSSSASPATSADSNASSTSTTSSKDRATSLTLGFGILGLLLALLVAAVMGLGSLFTKHDEMARVVDQSWSRSVPIEQFVSDSETAWCDALPTGAYQVSHFRAQRGSRQVEDGQDCHMVREDKGDGTFTKRRECETRWRSEPVYDQRCKFQVDRWRFVRSDTLQGNAASPPVWPSPQLSNSLLPGASPVLGVQRLGSPSESYRVTVKAESGEEWNCTLPELTWAIFRPNTLVRLKVRAVGGAVCDSLQLAN